MLQFVKANLSDTIFVQSIYEQCYPQKSYNHSDKSILNTGSSVCYLLLHLHRPIGFIHAQKCDNEAEIIDFCIIPRFQNNGYGRLLLQTFIYEMEWFGVHKIFLEVSKDNNVARHLYQKMGFHFLSERNHYYSLENNKQKKSALILKKILNS